MTSVLLAGGAGAKDPAWYCVDGAGMGSTTNYVPVWERGFRGMSGYVTHNYDIPQKCIEAWWELPDTWWMMNVEGDPHAGLGGAAVGTAYATNGIARVRDKGHLRETALVFSLVDFGPTAPQFPILDETHRAVIDVCMADGQMPGFYGPPVYLRHLAVMPWVPEGTVFWQWGGGGAPEWWTTVKQAGPSSDPPLDHDMSGFGFGADENILWTPMAGWTGYGINPPHPSTGVDMRQFVNNSEVFPAFQDEWGDQHNGPNPDHSFPPGWVVFEMVPGGKRNVPGAEWYALVPDGQPASLDARVGFFDYWTTGRIQSMPNVRYPGVTASPTTPQLTGLQIDRIPGVAAAIYG